ncbi:C69 family dipeptidase [Furfurilactobacillus entadae]|uniref:C69 family dipeptidase n=1 Tax=Furfurilactobacillus entadae TaxID=2922307 RepID=UPI0035E7DB34
MTSDDERRPSACTSILVGRQASLDGSIMIGRNEDSKASWPKHFVVHEEQTTTVAPIYKSKDNGFTTTLPLTALRYTATPEWTDKYGLFEEDGINSANVAMSATESAYSNETVLAADPFVADGIQEEAMVTVVLPYITTAREGVARLGALLEQHGTTESNGILFADDHEAWYMETAAGHQWVAQRIPDDGYAVVANQLAIQTVDFTDSDNFMFAAGIKDFVNDHNLNPDREGFNFRHIFGTHSVSDEMYNTPRVWIGQRMFNPEIDQEPTNEELPFIRRASHKISLHEVQDFLSNHYEGTDYDPVGRGAHHPHDFRPISLAKTQESHILQLRPTMPTELKGVQWLAMGVAAQSNYVPFYTAINDTPTAYKRGTGRYAPTSAYWTFKLASTLWDAHYRHFERQYQQVRTDLRVTLGSQLAASDATAMTLTGTELTDFLTAANDQAAKRALSAYRDLISTLVTASTDFSPLNFSTDENL